MTEDKELEEWRRQWQGLGGTATFAKDVVVRARRDEKRMRRDVVGEVTATAFLLVVSMWIVVRSHGSVEAAVIAGVLSLFGGAWLTYFFTVRAGLFRGSGEGLEAFVALTRKRLVAEMRWTRYARLWTSAIGLVVAPWAVWFFVAHFDKYRAEPWRAVVGFGTAACIYIGSYVYARRKERRVAAEARRFERQVADAELAVPV